MNLSSQAKKLARAAADWSFILAYAIAHIDAQGQSVALLAHDLANVRQGAWMGLGSVGTVALVKMLDEKRMQSDAPLFREAAYRAIDVMLTSIESRGGEPGGTSWKPGYRRWRKSRTCTRSLNGPLYACNGSSDEPTRPRQCEETRTTNAPGAAE